MNDLEKMKQSCVDFEPKEPENKEPFWIPIDIENLPKEKVIAVCFDIQDKKNYKKKIGIGLLEMYGLVSTVDVLLYHGQMQISNATHYATFESLLKLT